VPTLSPTITTAEIQANANWSANLAALSITQQSLCESLRNIPVDLTWVYARDGSLTGMTPDGKWWADCSVPLLAGRSLLRSLEPSNLMSCYLAPAHAGLVQSARERNGDEPAMLVVAPDPVVLRVILSSYDFSAQIASHHLWFVTAENWADQAKQLFENYPGLPTPGRFIRTKLTPDEIIDPMIAEAQHILSAVMNDRTRQIETIRTQSPKLKNTAKTLVIAGSRFRLWDDAPAILLDEFSNGSTNLQIQRFDGDDPATSAPLALATAAADCDRIISANIARADAANLVADDTPWITWITRLPIPKFAHAGPNDRLIVADPIWQTTAEKSGWPSHRVTVCGWPYRPVPVSKNTEQSLVILADTQPIIIPPSIEDLSSHRVLWEMIEAELAGDPLSFGDDAIGFLDIRSRQLNIDVDTVDRRRFIDLLLLPAYQQGLARLLMQAGLTLQLHGRGWDELDEFRSIAHGPVLSRDQFLGVVSNASALVHIWPIRHAHQIDSLGKPVVYRTGRRKETFVRQATMALRNEANAPPPTGNPLAAAIIRS
jgi:hypothetical protein